MANPVAGFPDATNTGVQDQSSLSTYTGPMTIATDGTVIENQVINGTLTVTGSDVVIKDCVINFDSWYGVRADNASNLTIENCTITGPGINGDSTAAIYGSGDFLNNNISQTEHGIDITGPSSVTGNYIHDLNDGASPHYDGICLWGGGNGVLIEDNTIVGRQTADINLTSDFGPINDVTVTHNLLLGDPNYDIYVDGRPSGSGSITNVSITDNYIEKGYYGDFMVADSSPTISGNVIFDQGTTPTQTIDSTTTTTTDPSTTTTTDPSTTTTTDPTATTAAPTTSTTDTSTTTATTGPTSTTDSSTSTTDPTTSTTDTTGSTSGSTSTTSGHHYHHGWHSSMTTTADATTTSTTDPYATAVSSTSDTSSSVDWSHHHHHHHDASAYFADHFTI